jgi:hypothetical protein
MRANATFVPEIAEVQDFVDGSGRFGIHNMRSGTVNERYFPRGNLNAV